MSPGAERIHLQSKRLPITLLILGLAAPLAMAQATTWNLDPAHSEVDFTVKHMGLSNVHGRIGVLKGTISQNDADITKSSVSVTMDMSTVDTGVGMRDNDLKGANYFDAAQFLMVMFTSTSVSGAAGHLTIAGNLTLHGVTRPVTLDVEGPSGPVNGMGNKVHEGFSATTVNRKDFGVGANTRTEWSATKSSSRLIWMRRSSNPLRGLDLLSSGFSAPRLSGTQEVCGRERL